jgi:hypothetical protein
VKLIALSGRAGSGKSTVAKHLVAHHGFVPVKFAGPLKSMLRALGLTDEHLEGTLKEIPSKLLCGKTPRHAMQTLGAEWGRQHIGEALWVNAWRDIVVDVLDLGGKVVVDDLRFENEGAAVRGLDGGIIELRRREASLPQTHSSERLEVLPDWTVRNFGSIDDMLTAVESIITYGRKCE